MINGPFDIAGSKIPVTVIGPGGAMPLPGPGVVVLQLGPEANHAHGNGDLCPACEARTDVRALLFNLLEAARQGLRPPFRSVLLDARELGDVESVVAALEGRLPARALRDHTVARRFRLTG